MSRNYNMAAETNVCPPPGGLRGLMKARPLPTIDQGTVDPESVTGERPTRHALTVATQFNKALFDSDVSGFEACFFPKQAYWKDNLALTCHLRTFTTPSVITTSFLELEMLRRIPDGIQIDGEARFVPFNPTLQFIESSFKFATESPAAHCTGKLYLLPFRSDGGNLEWKIWILSTRLKGLDLFPENEKLLRTPRKSLDRAQKIKTDVIIIGGGNAAATLAARLKTLNVGYLMVEKNPRVGDNWALRYDSLKFHVPTSLCETPFLGYDKALQSPHLVSRDDLAEHLRRYVETLQLNVITSAKTQLTIYNTSMKQWTVALQTPTGQVTVTSKQLVLATGCGSQKPYLPHIKDKELYRGISVHSNDYKNCSDLKNKGVKSMIIVGSANTAFDVLEDGHAAGIKSTMVARSPTYVVPLKHVTDVRSLGVYDLGVDAADNFLLSLPVVVDAALGRDIYAGFAAAEPDRYKRLAAAGFPVFDGTDERAVLVQNLIERAGGHYVDIGGTDLIADGKVDVKGGVEPVAFTTTGLRFSDGSTLNADAVVWCTGFSDTNMRDVVAEVLGGGGRGNDSIGVSGSGDFLGPQQIAARMDATWGVDEEGEIRGLWKRQSRLENFWVMAGYTQQQRWHSLTLALQIKGQLEGILPPAYLDTPATP